MGLNIMNICLKRDAEWITVASKNTENCESNQSVRVKWAPKQMNKEDKELIKQNNSTAVFTDGSDKKYENLTGPP